MSCCPKRRFPTISCCGPDQPKPMSLKERSRGMKNENACYKYMTSRVLSAAAGGQYYGPDDQCTFAQLPQKDNPVSERQLFNTVVCCGGQCPPDIRIFPPFCKSSPKACIYVPDIATEWYAEEYKRRTGIDKKSEPKGPQLAPIGKHCYPTQKKKLKVPVRVLKQRALKETNIKRISPEFLNLLKQHDEWIRERYPIYSVRPSYLRVMNKKRLTDEDVAEQARKSKIVKPALYDDLCGCGMAKEYDKFSKRVDPKMCYPTCSGRPPYGKKPATAKPAAAGSDPKRTTGKTCDYATHV